MGESRHNPRSIAARQPDPSKLARMAQPRRHMQEGLGGRFKPKRNVLIMPTDCMRTLEDGTVEVREPEGEWQRPPEGARVFAEGSELGLEDLDYAIELHSVCVNTSLVMAGGRAPTSIVPIAELGRVDATALTEMHERNFRGGDAPEAEAKAEDAPAPALVTP